MDIKNKLWTNINNGTYNINPFLKPRHKAHSCYLEALLATAAATKQIIAWAKDPEAAAGAFLVLARDEDLVEVVVVQRMVDYVVWVTADVPAVDHDALEVVAASVAGLGAFPCSGDCEA